MLMGPTRKWEASFVCMNRHDKRKKYRKERREAALTAPRKTCELMRPNDVDVDVAVDVLVDVLPERWDE